MIKTDGDDAFDDEEDDEDEIYTKQIIMKLQRIQDSDQRFLCEYLIETAIHMASLHELTDTTQIMESPKYPMTQRLQNCPENGYMSNQYGYERGAVRQSEGNYQHTEANDELPFVSFYKRVSNFFIITNESDFGQMYSLI